MVIHQQKLFQELTQTTDDGNLNFEVVKFSMQLKKSSLSYFGSNNGTGVSLTYHWYSLLQWLD